eukprot:634094-Alexandrium_andersonii.AAC.1
MSFQLAPPRQPEPLPANTQLAIYARTCAATNCHRAPKWHQPKGTAITTEENMPRSHIRGVESVARACFGPYTLAPPTFHAELPAKPATFRVLQRLRAPRCNAATHAKPATGARRMESRITGRQLAEEPHA